jgi:Rab proteins geranylgeranyltransferase component A
MVNDRTEDGESLGSSHIGKQSDQPKEVDLLVISDDSQRDDEGLLLEYDVVICGTGLVQSILASALTRAGKTVLHCDGSDMYGELDAVWTFDTIQDLYNQQPQQQQQEQISSDEENSWISLSPKGSTTSLQFHSLHTTRYFGIEVGTEVESPFGTGTVRSIDLKNECYMLQLELQGWKLADQKSPIVFINIPDTVDVSRPATLEEYLHTHQRIRSRITVQAVELLKLSRFFALDATPGLILASGRAVKGMLASNVADYLEFKAIEGLYWLEAKSENNDADTPTAFELTRVPCSKNDIFSTKLLSPMDKRRFMKFIQLSMDYATKMTVVEESQGESLSLEVEVLSLNERHLNQSRSLARPQNKTVATNELQVLQQCIAENNLTFEAFMTQYYKLSAKLRSIVRYALAWETEQTSTDLATGMAALRQHLQALGRYGTTAFLCPMYGSGELSQAFCRSAAVFGATYLLRRAPLAIHYSEKDDRSDAIKGVMLSGDTTGEQSTQQIAKKMVKCSHVVVPLIAILKSGTPTRRIVRRLSILKGKLIPSDSGEQRYVIFIPPGTIGNSHAIHCVLLDRSVAVSPYGCTLVHLTTTANLEDCKNLEAMLEHAKNVILSSKCPGTEPGGESGATPVELYHVTFSHATTQEDPQDESSNFPAGVHVCSHSRQTLTADVVFEQAERLFSTICPGMEFFGLSNTFDETVRERAQEKRYDDDEQMMLESALGMIGDGQPAVDSSVDTGPSPLVE